jgi:class 3 adenylate cyclase
MQGVAEWLASIGLDEYVQRFVENAIDLSVVRDLTEQDLKDLGMPLGHRRRLLRAVTLLAEDSVIGSQTAPVQGHAERRQLTILFCDLVGSTALSARFDPEDFRRVILAYNARVSEVIREYRGKITQYMGDGVLAYFGYPHADDDDAKHALLAGLALIDAVANLQIGIGTKLQVRIGIATGLVVVGDLTCVGTAQEPVAIGEAPNLAARLQGLAEPGTALVDTISHQLTACDFDFTDLGPRPVAGWAEPVRVWRVLRKVDVESRFAAKHMAQVPPLFGREEEMELLVRRWRQALRKEGCVVLLTGEPGIGKSHIVRAVEEQLRSDPHIRMHCFCSAYHTNSALFPIISQLEHAARFGQGDSPAEKLSKLETLLAQSTTEPEHVEVLSELLALPARDHSRLQELSPSALKEKIFAALLSQLDGLAAQSPIYLVFEDIQWIDPTSMELLTSLIERVPELPIFLFITVRPGFTPPWPNYPHITTIEIMPLHRRDCATLVERMGGETLPKEVLNEILTRSDGVPLFIEELTKTVLEASVLRKEEESGEFDDTRLHTIPTTLHGALLARLDRLGPGREVAQIGAAIGRQFSYDLLRAVAEMSEPMLRMALDRLVASGLVYRRASTPTTLISVQLVPLYDRMASFPWASSTSVRLNLYPCWMEGTGLL